MSDDLGSRAVATFRTRLQSLSAWMAKAEQQWTGQGRDLAELVAARLAPDMHPFPWQIVFTCNQPHEYAAWCRGEIYIQPDPAALDWAALRQHVAATLATLDQPLTPPADKHIDLPPANAHLDLTAQRYVDDWLLPNFYFHLVTSYGLLRMSGIDLGKVDYMMHLAGDVQPNG